MTRIDDNTDGVDLIAIWQDNTKYYIECKNRQALSWNVLKKFWEKTKKHADRDGATAVVVFKSNYQPCLCYIDNVVTYIENVFSCEYKKRPKGYKLWR